jgi:two-component system, LuxR family, response regulator FixJ
MTTTVHVIDPDVRRRARLVHIFRPWQLHAEIYEDLAEFRQMPEHVGYIFAADEDLSSRAEDAVAAVRSLEPFTPLVLYAEQPQLERVVDAVKAGAADYLAWPFEARLLRQALEKLARDASPDLVKRRSQRGDLIKTLSRREMQVLEELLRGARNKDIAKHLDISARTVEIHRANLMRKLGANSVAEAVRMGIEAGLTQR